MPNQEPQTIGFLMPMFIFAIALLVLNVTIAKRKGKSLILFAFPGVIPMVNVISIVYLISLTDKDVVDKLNTIIEKLNK